MASTYSATYDSYDPLLFSPGSQHAGSYPTPDSSPDRPPQRSRHALRGKGRGLPIGDVESDLEHDDLERTESWYLKPERTLALLERLGAPFESQIGAAGIVAIYADADIRGSVGSVSFPCKLVEGLRIFGPKSAESMQLAESLAQTHDVHVVLSHPTLHPLAGPSHLATSFAPQSPPQPTPASSSTPSPTDVVGLASGGAVPQKVSTAPPQKPTLVGSGEPSMGVSGGSGGKESVQEDVDGIALVDVDVKGKGKSMGIVLKEHVLDSEVWEYDYNRKRQVFETSIRVHCPDDEASYDPIGLDVKMASDVTPTHPSRFLTGVASIRAGGEVKSVATDLQNFAVQAPVDISTTVAATNTNAVGGVAGLAPAGNYSSVRPADLRTVKTTHGVLTPWYTRPIALSAPSQPVEDDSSPMNGTAFKYCPAPGPSGDAIRRSGLRYDFDVRLKTLPIEKRALPISVSTFNHLFMESKVGSPSFSFVIYSQLHLPDFWNAGSRRTVAFKLDAARKRITYLPKIYPGDNTEKAAAFAGAAGRPDSSATGAVKTTASKVPRHDRDGSVEKLAKSLKAALGVFSTKARKSRQASREASLIVEAAHPAGPLALGGPSAIPPIPLPVVEFPAGSASAAVPTVGCVGQLAEVERRQRQQTEDGHGPEYEFTGI